MAEGLPDIPDCLARVRQRDEAAARSLVQHLYPLVIKIVRAHLPRRTEEEDLAQIVFVKMFAHLEQYAGNVPLEHWVSRIAVNTCLNQLRAEKCRPELRWADLDADQAEVLSRAFAEDRDLDPAAQLASRELVEQILQTLPPTDRLILTLLDLEGRSVEEIRRTTGWNSSFIKVRAFRARRRLRRQCRALRKELQT
jgi:RNA polymerase sigma-70 factor (ECF subfamily)